MWVVQAQDLLWGMLTERPDAGLVSAPVALYESWRFRDSGPAFGLPLPLATIAVLAVVFGLFQVFYLDRLAIRIGDPTRPVDARRG
jgi:hypothetical protein